MSALYNSFYHKDPRLLYYQPHEQMKYAALNWWSFPLEIPTRSVLIVLPSENLMSHLPLSSQYQRYFWPVIFFSKLCRSGYFWLRIIRRVRRCLTLTATQLLVQALVLSRLDYCNALLLSPSQRQISRLQLVENSSARLVTWTILWREQAEHCTAPVEPYNIRRKM